MQQAWWFIWRYRAVQHLRFDVNIRLAHSGKMFKCNASAIGYVGELCRYLMDAPVTELDHNHRVTKMIGNGMRPNIWDKFKQRFGVKEVLELYASSEGNVGFSNIFNFDNTVGFSPTPYAIIQFDKEKRT